MTDKNTNIHLFSYGTLQQANVQQALFGRQLVGKPAILTHYKLQELLITDQDVLQKSGLSTHPIATFTDNPSDQVAGMVFTVSKRELEEANRYEVDEYESKEVILQNGQKAWVYIKKT